MVAGRRSLLACLVIAFLVVLFCFTRDERTLTREQRFQRFMVEMCGATNLSLARVTRAIRKAQAIGGIVGHEYWDTVSLDELAGTVVEWNLTATVDYTSDVLFVVARNPRNGALEERARQRLAFRRATGQARVEWLSFGEHADVAPRFDWIRRHVFNGSYTALLEQTQNGTRWYNHGYGALACLTSLQALHRFANASERFALIMETDAVPTHRFGEKFRALLAQLAPLEFDLVHMGTCAGRGFNDFQMVTPNLATPHSLPTRCFNAVLFSRRGVAKVLGAGAVMGDRFRNCDHLFNDLTPTLNLTHLWAQPPLFSEESKTPTRFFCQGQ